MSIVQYPVPSFVAIAYVQRETFFVLSIHELPIISQDSKFFRAYLHPVIKSPVGFIFGPPLNLAVCPGSMITASGRSQSGP